MLHADLKVASGKQMGSLIQLPLGKFLIGREEDCHLRPNSDLVSRHHCVFTVDDFAVRLRDLGSTNGTFVNGERVRGAVVLNNGDKVSIGKLDFEVIVREASGDETTPSLSMETETQVPAPQPSAEPAPASSSDTLSEIHLPADATQPAQPTTADTQYAQNVPMPTGPTMAYPMGYPGQFMQPYGYPAYPGMYPQQMGYPAMYGQPGMMPPHPGQPQSSPEVSGQGSSPEVRLPDPESTGAKPPEAKPQGKSGGGTQGNEAPDKAAEIIKQYSQRRPTSGSK